MAELLVDGEIVLYGTVGTGLFGDGFTSLDVVQALAKVGRGNDVAIRLNSGGGYVMEGLGVYNALAAHKGHKTVYVDGVAASAASLIAMAGDQIVMRKGALMMIHDPAGMTMGTVEDHEKQVQVLSAMADSAASIYADRSGKTIEAARDDMRKETWLSGKQAVDAGYATNVIEAEALDPTMFGYHQYRHPPSFVMMSDVPKPKLPEKKQEVIIRGDNPPVLKWKALNPTINPSQQEFPMATNDSADTIPANIPAISEADVQRRLDEAITQHNARTMAILDSEEAKGREDLAKFLAFSTVLDVDASKAALSRAAKVAEPAPNPFEARMSATPNPQVGPDDSVMMSEDDEATALAKKIVAFQLGH